MIEEYLTHAARWIFDGYNGLNVICAYVASLGIWAGIDDCRKGRNPYERIMRNKSDRLEQKVDK